MTAINFQQMTIDASNKDANSKQARIDLIKAVYNAAGGTAATEKTARAMLADVLPIVVKSWGAQIKGDVLVYAPDSDSIRSARKRLLAEIKEACEGSFSFAAKSKKTKEGVNVTVYEYIAKDAAEKATKEREKKAQANKDKKAKDAEAAIQQRITEATKSMVSKAEHEQLKANIIDPKTCSDADALAMLAKWAQECTRRNLNISKIILRNTAPARPAMPATGKAKKRASS